MPKFLCTQGHLHNEQWLADNCATCKRNARRRTLRSVSAFSHLGGALAPIGLLPHRPRVGKPLSSGAGRAIRRRLGKKAVR